MRLGTGGLIRLVVGWLAVVILTASVTTLVVTRVGQDVAGELDQPAPGATAAGPVGPGPSTRGRKDTGTPAPADADPAPNPSTNAPDTSESVDPLEPADTSAATPGARKNGGDGPRADGEAVTGSSPSARQAGAADGGGTGGRMPVATASRSVEPPAAGGVSGSSPAAWASFSAVGGVVTVMCRGREAEVRSAAPHNGYRFEVEAEGPSASVSFTNGSRTDDIEVSCRSGQATRSDGES